MFRAGVLFARTGIRPRLTRRGERFYHGCVVSDDGSSMDSNTFVIVRVVSVVRVVVCVCGVCCVVL